MKKFIRTLQGLSQRVAQFQETLQQVPPKVAEIRQAVSLTSGQLRQLQADVQMNVASLKADNPDRLVEALHEINGSNEVFQEAGYELARVEMELSPAPRLIVHLDRVQDVRDSILHRLASANQERRVTHALLNAIIQAEAVADRVDIERQVYYRLIVHVGPVPSVRLGWMPEAAGPSTPSATLVAAASPASMSAESAPASHFSAYGKSSFFGSQAEEPDQTSGAPVAESSQPSAKAAVVVEEPSGSAVARPRPQPSHAPQVTAPETKDWGKSALERFKQMPGASKYASRKS